MPHGFRLVSGGVVVQAAGPAVTCPQLPRAVASSRVTPGCARRRAATGRPDRLGLSEAPLQGLTAGPAIVRCVFYLPQWRISGGEWCAAVGLAVLPEPMIPPCPPSLPRLSPLSIPPDP